jgi:hypothetical protein
VTVPSNPRVNGAAGSPFGGRRLTSLLARWASARKLGDRRAEMIRQAILSVPAQPDFDWWWRLFDPTNGTVFRATRATSASSAAAMPSSHETDETPLEAVTAGRWWGTAASWRPEGGVYQAYLRLG